MNLTKRILRKKLPLRLVILASGGGTTALAVFMATLATGILHGLIEVVCVVISDPSAGAKQKLIAAGFPKDCIRTCNPEDYGKDKVAFGRALIAIFDEFKIDLFGQYGWLPKTPENVLEKYWGVNQHPALTNGVGGKSFFGIWPHIAMVVLSQLVKRELETVATAQLVGGQYDSGAIIHCEGIPVDKNEKANELQQRLLPVEHRVQIRALEMIARALEAGKCVPTQKVIYFTRRERFLLEFIQKVFIVAQAAGVKG
ncbi:MAG: formyltransferase family protein [bacterium]|nr:formyltransferase family protein [bacterium]